MDLLGDIGYADQLAAARSENAMLKQRVQELTARVRILEIEKASLEVEVEEYRKEMVIPNFSTLALGGKATTTTTTNNNKNNTTTFMKSGDGVFCRVPAIILNDTTISSNRLCCCLDSNDRMLATGFADGTLQLQFWGDDDNNTNTTTLRFSAPVITCSFYRDDILAIGCMDGACIVAQIRTVVSSSNNKKQIIIAQCTAPITPRHGKYVKNVCFHRTQPLLATSSADGNIHIYKIEHGTTKDSETMMMVTDTDEEEKQACAPTVTHLHSLHFDTPVEAMIFAGSKLICHVRDSPHLHVIDDESWELHNVDIHEGSGGFENHVSFCVLDLQLSPNNQYLACATDAHRHIVLDLSNDKDYRIIRNLYGHEADNYSSPVIAWSANSQYIYSNHQHEAKIMVYELASGKIVTQLSSQHTRPIKSLYSSKTSNTLVSVSWDRSTVIWFTE